MTWVSEYDFDARSATLTLVTREDVGIHWARIWVDESLSDPDGNFTVFSARHRDTGEAVPVKVIARLNDGGGLLCPHGDFNAYALGSPTIWPAEAIGDHNAGSRAGGWSDEWPLRHWIWFDVDSIWRDDDPPTPWPGRSQEG